MSSHLADEIIAGECVLVPHLQLQLDSSIRRVHLQWEGGAKRKDEKRMVGILKMLGGWFLKSWLRRGGLIEQLTGKEKVLLAGS